MPAKRPGQGQLDNAVNLEPEAGLSNRKAVSNKNAGHAKDRVEQTGRGLRVRLSRVPQTSRKVLSQPYYFQVPPLETFSTQYGYNFSDYETIDAGQFSRAMARQLRIIEFQTMFVDQDWFFTLYQHTNTGPNPQRMAAELVQILNTGTPFQLLIGQPRLWGDGNFDVEMTATLRTMTVEERAGEIDARYVNVSFTEWRELDVKKDRKGEALPYTYTIKDGDTLRELAKTNYGESRLWRLIANANHLNVRHDVDLSNLKREGRQVNSLYIPAPLMGVGSAQAVARGGK